MDFLFYPSNAYPAESFAFITTTAGEKDLIMSNIVKISVIGGDLRQLITAGLFFENGIETAVFGFDNYTGEFPPVVKCLSAADAIFGATAVVLPLPCTLDDESLNAPLHDKKIMLNDIFRHLTAEQILCAGMYSADRPNTFDYYEREDFKILNSIPTAEGAIAIALNETPITLHGAKTVILGYGRIGKILAERLKGLGCTVTVVSKKDEDLAFCEAYSYNPVPIKRLSKAIADADIIFNTIPAVILNLPTLNYVNKQTLIIDLAARPGGVDFDAAKQLGIKVNRALSLPGKVAPVTAGGIVYKTVCNILKQEGVL